MSDRWPGRPPLETKVIYLLPVTPRFRRGSRGRRARDQHATRSGPPTPARPRRTRAVLIGGILVVVIGVDVGLAVTRGHSAGPSLSSFARRSLRRSRLEARCWPGCPGVTQKDAHTR